MNEQEFANKIRQKYPGSYDNMSDTELTQKVIAKYPVYADSVKITQPTTPAIKPNSLESIKNSIGGRVVNALTSSEQNFGQDIAGALSNILPEKWTGVADIKKANETHAKTMDILISQIKDRREKGMDVSNLVNILKDEAKNAPPQWADLYPSLK